MRIIDLTHKIHKDISVYPGTMAPNLKQVGEHEKDGYKETLLTMLSHTGTHVDAPSHIYADGKNLEDFDASSFVGKAIIINISSIDSNTTIESNLLENDDLSDVDFLLFYYGADKKFGSEAFYEDYPVLSTNFIDLINKSNLKGIGFDVIGLDKISNTNLDLHKLLFKNNNIINIENLNNLGVVYELIGNQPFNFIALPLKFIDSDGAPIRAIAMID